MANSYATGDTPVYVPVLAVGQSVSVPVWATPSATVGTWTMNYLGSGMLPTRNNSTNAQNDAATWHVNLPAGTYTIDVVGATGPAKAQLLLKDGSTTLVSGATMDFYTAGAGNKNVAATGVVIAASGDHAIQMVAATRNASNTTGFTFDIGSLIFTRTA